MSTKDATPEGVASSEGLGLVPKFWLGPNGASMPAEFYAPWSTAYPKEAQGWEPLFTAEQVRLVQIAERELCARLRGVLSMVLDDIGVCYGECGTDWEPKDLSTETLEALLSYRGAL